MSELVQRLEPEEAEPLADRRKGRAHMIIERCVGCLELRRFTEVDEFLDIAWQEVAATRFLTEGRSRTLRSVAETIIERYGSFSSLVQAADLSPSQQNAFRSCSVIEEKLRADGYAAFEWYEPWLVPTVTGDRGSTTTRWYIAEGVHSAIVRAVELVRDPQLWQPVNAVVCCERVV